MKADEGAPSWPRAAQFLFVFFLGAISSAVALRIHSSQPRPLERREQSSFRRSDPRTIEPSPVRRAHARAEPSTHDTDGVWVRSSAEVQETPRRTGKVVPLTSLNINRASREELMQLPGVGPVLADRIVAEREKRPFRRVDDLTRVSGIGVKTLSRLRPYVHVEDDE